jgi:hypothetical protein
MKIVPPMRENPRPSAAGRGQGVGVSAGYPPPILKRNPDRGRPAGAPTPTPPRKGEGLFAVAA